MISFIVCWRMYAPLRFNELRRSCINSSTKHNKTMCISANVIKCARGMSNNEAHVFLETSNNTEAKLIGRSLDFMRSNNKMTTMSVNTHTRHLLPLPTPLFTSWWLPSGLRCPERTLQRALGWIRRPKYSSNQGHSRQHLAIFKLEVPLDFVRFC